MQTTNLPERVSLNEVAKHLKVHVATVYRWTLQGVRGKRLPSFLIGGRRYVALTDLEQFLRPTDRSVGEVNSRRADQARERLRSYGIKSLKDDGGAA